MDDARELIERLQGAECGSRELDGAIECHIRGGGFRCSALPGVIGDEWGTHDAPPYTTSLDVALTLVSERRLKHLSEGKSGAWVVYLIRRERNWQEEPPMPVVHTSLPLALCIAALRARTAQVQP